MCECARRVLKRRSLEGKKVLPPGAPNFLPRATLFLVGSSVLGDIHLVLVEVARGPHWPFPGPEQLVRIWNIAQRLLAITNILKSHGLGSPSLSHTLNWRDRAPAREKLKKSEILGIASWLLWSHGLISP